MVILLVKSDLKPENSSFLDDRHLFNFRVFQNVLAVKRKTKKKITSKKQKTSDVPEFDPKILKKSGKINLGVPFGAMVEKSPTVGKSPRFPQYIIEERFDTAFIIWTKRDDWTQSIARGSYRKWLTKRFTNLVVHSEGQSVSYNLMPNSSVYRLFQDYLGGTGPYWTIYGIGNRTIL